MINREEHVHKRTSPYMWIDESILNELIVNNFNYEGYTTRQYATDSIEIVCKIVDKYRIDFAFVIEFQNMFYSFIKETEEIIYVRKYSKPLDYPVHLDYDVKGTKEEVYSFIKNN